MPRRFLHLFVLLALSLGACDRTPVHPKPPPPIVSSPASAPTQTPPPTPPPFPSPTHPTTPPTSPPTTPSFLPSLHGFAFVNAFKGSPLPPSLRPLQAALGPTVPSHFGLCGGMCAAAADYFLAGDPIPDTTTIPTQGQPLFEYLYQRQSDSFAGTLVPLRVLTGMATPDTGASGLQSMNAKELPAIVSRLAKGELVQLCLILGKADGKTKPWDNHQVLAYAHCAPDTSATTPAASTTTTIVLKIYDPNYPKDDQATLTFTPTTSGLTCIRTAHRASAKSPIITTVRGVFAAPYIKRSPQLAPPSPAADRP